MSLLAGASRSSGWHSSCKSTVDAPMPFGYYLFYLLSPILSQFSQIGGMRDLSQMCKLRHRCSFTKDRWGGWERMEGGRTQGPRHCSHRTVSSFVTGAQVCKIHKILHWAQSGNKDFQNQNWGLWIWCMRERVCVCVFVCVTAEMDLTPEYPLCVWYFIVTISFSSQQLCEISITSSILWTARSTHIRLPN